MPVGGDFLTSMESSIAAAPNRRFRSLAGKPTTAEERGGCLRTEMRGGAEGTQERSPGQKEGLNHLTTASLDLSPTSIRGERAGLLAHKATGRGLERRPLVCGGAGNGGPEGPGQLELGGTAPPQQLNYNVAFRIRQERRRKLACVCA